MDKFIMSYYDWLKNNTVINQINGCYEECTPFLDTYNDSISIYHHFDKNKITISDGGYILDEFELLGINIKRGRRKEVFQNFLNSFQLELRDDELIVEANKENYFQKKHFFIQGMLRIEDMFLLNRSNIKSSFIDDVASYFETLDINYSEDIILSGKSKLEHNIDFIIPNKNQEKVIKLSNHLNKNILKINLFMFEDIKDSRRRESKFYMLINDTNTPPKKEHIEAIKEYKITPLLWSSKDLIKKELENAV